MTTFAELEDLVVSQTRRPEISTVTKAAIRTATLRAHHTDFFPKDLVESNILYTPSSTAMLYNIPDVSTLLTRLRSLKTIYGADAITGRPVESLEFREMDDLYDSDGNIRPSIYTLLGDTLRVYPQNATGSLLAYYYANPDTAELTYNSWIANLYPDELAQWAAAIVFVRTGFSEIAQQIYQLNITPFKEMLVAGHLLGNVS